MAMVFFVPYDFGSVQAAIAKVVRQMRWSHTFRYDELIPGGCEWCVLDPLTQEEKGTIHLRKLGEGVRLSIPAVRDIANVLVPGLQSLGVPIQPRKQLLPLGGSQGQASQNTRAHGTQGGTLDRAAEARSLIEAGVPKTKACRRAGIDVRTYDRYVDLLVDWGDETD